MHIKKNILLLLVLILNFSALNSQIVRDGEPLTQGAVVYSLPQSVIRVQVTIERESFTPGIYAQYAQKCFGQAAQTSRGSKVRIKQIGVEQVVEADPSFNVALNIGTSKNATANFLNFSRHGLIISPGAFASSDSGNGFGNSLSPLKTTDNQGYEKELIAPSGTKTTTIYKEIADEDGNVERVPQKVVQSVERNLEQRAKESAALIFDLRDKKIAILTGDTDANYEGAALGAAMSEFDNLDKELTSLFYGTKSISYQTMSFEIVPKAGASSQRYVICRLSDTDGILPASANAGRELLLQLEPQGKIYAEPSNESMTSSKGKIVYRTPVAAQAKILDGGKVVGEVRVALYQFGKILYFPLELSAGK